MWYVVFFRYVPIPCDSRFNQMKDVFSVLDIIDEPVVVCLPPVALLEVPTCSVILGDAPEKINFFPYTFQISFFESEDEVISVVTADIENRVVRI